MHEITDIIESLLFVAEEPLSLDKLKIILETVESKEIKAALQTLADRYDSRGGGFALYEVAGGWQLRSRPEYTPWIKRLLQPSPQRLSKPALETLAIVAYNQPIIRADIEHIRGVDCGGVLRQLMERKLIRVLGRKEIPGRPLIYATTKLFLETFGLKDLRDLPSPKEIEEMASAMEENAGVDGSEAARPLEPWTESGNFDDIWNTGGEADAPATPRRPRNAVQRVNAWPVRSTTGASHGSRHGSELRIQPRPSIDSSPPRIACPQSCISAANDRIKIGWRHCAIF
jgi:segregation and condensation protein B